MLSAEVFSDVVKSLANAGQARPADKRRVRRVLHCCRVPITLCDQADYPTTIEVTLRDLSSRGACILYNRPMAAGSQFVLSLHREKADPIRLLASIVHCRAHGKSLYVIGAEFTCILPAVSSRA